MIKHTSTGSVVEITPNGMILMAVTLDGRSLGTSHLCRMGKTYTGPMAGYIDTTPRIGLTRAELSQLNAEIASGKPPIAEPLPITRELLNGRIRDLADDYTRAIERAGEGRPMDLTLRAKIDAAINALADWDVAHPADVAAREAHKAEMISRFDRRD